ncbi:MAG: hypothetical protein AB2993_00895 [Candidatus Symbiodolus clandestinus]
MKRLSIVPSWARQAKRDKPQRFKQLPTSWWSVLHAYLKKLRRAAQKSSTSCQTTVNHSPHPSAPIKTLHQKVYPKQQLWQRLKGPSTDSHSTLGSNITSSCSQPSVNFSLRLSPAIPAGSHSLAHRGLSALLINHPSLKVSGISQLTDMNSLLKYASLKPLPLIIHTSTPTLSILPLPESQHNQKKAALVYLPKQINYLPPLPPRMEVDRPPQPLDADGQWLANKPQVIDPAGETTNLSPERATVKETEPEKPTQKKSQDKSFEKAVFFNTSKNKYQESRKRCHPYFDFDVKLAEPPKKRARLASDLDKTSPSLIESENKVAYPFIELEEPPKKYPKLEFNSTSGEVGTPLVKAKSTPVEMEPEKSTQKKSQNTTCKRRLFFYILKECQELPTSQKSKKCCHPDSGSELLEPPKKRAKLEYNPYLDEAETPLNEPENDIVYPSLEKFSVTEKEPEKRTQIESQSITFKTRFFPKISMEFRESRKRRNPYSDSALAESPKKPATLASSPDLNEIGTPLIESKNKDKQSIKYDDYGVETTTEKTDSSSEKWSGSELSNSEPSETETAIESDWCYPLAAYGYDTQRYPLLTQLPDDCHWGKRILRDFKPEYTFWLDNEEKSMLWGVRHYPVLAEFFQIDPLTYQHPYLEQAINAYTAPTESLSNSTRGDSSPPNNSNLAD